MLWIQAPDLVQGVIWAIDSINTQAPILNSVTATTHLVCFNKITAPSGRLNHVTSGPAPHPTEGCLNAFFLIVQLQLI